MVTVNLLLMVLALVFLAMGAAGVGGRLNWTSAGLFCWALATVVRV